MKQKPQFEGCGGHLLRYIQKQDEQKGAVVGVNACVFTDPVTP